MNIAVVGLGLMGREAALRLHRLGHRVVGWNRTPEKAQSLRDEGIALAESAAQAVVESDLALLFLSDVSAIRQSVLSGSGLRALSGAILVQMGTIAPAESREVAAAVGAAGGRYLECPVLGSLPEVRDGRLILMAGGDAGLFAECLPALRCLGPEPVLIGEVGKAAALKLAMNQLIASLAAAFSLSLGLVRAEGIDTESFLSLLRASPLYAPIFDKKLPNYLSGDYRAANFPLKHLLKDLRLFRAAAAGAGLETASLAALEAACQRAQAEGWGDLDYSVLYQALTAPGSAPGQAIDPRDRDAH